MGRGDAFDVGNIACHAYFEVETVGLDLARFERAWQLTVARHDMLRATVQHDGLQRILPEPTVYRIACDDLRPFSPSEAETAALATRARMSHQVHRECPLFEVHATRFDEEHVRLHFSVDLLIGDALSFQIAARDCAAYYSDPDCELPALAISYRDYVLAEIAFRKTELYRRSEAYWSARLDDLPPAPELPLATSPASVATPRFSRRTSTLSHDAWARFKKGAHAHGLTPSALLLAAYAEVLARWAKSAAVHPNPHRWATAAVLIPQVDSHRRGVHVDSTRLEIEAPDGRRSSSARTIQRRRHDDLATLCASIARPPGFERVEELARRSRHAEGVASRAARSSRGHDIAAEAPRRTPADGWAPVLQPSPQTPQIWLDIRLYEGDGGSHFNWDAVEDLFPDGSPSRCSPAYRASIGKLDSPDAAGEARTDRWSSRAAGPSSPRQTPPQAAHRYDDLRCRCTSQSFLPEAARRSPEAPALITTERAWSYRELYARVRDLAARIAARMDLKSAEPVAVVAEKGWAQIVAVAAVVEAGGAYVPIDASLAVRPGARYPRTERCAARAGRRSRRTRAPVRRRDHGARDRRRDAFARFAGGPAPRDRQGSRVHHLHLRARPASRRASRSTIAAR